MERVDTIKYLGVRIHSKLRWSDHITDVATKANRILNFLRRSMFGCSISAKHWAYSTLVRPRLEYCAPVWSPYQLKDCDRLERYQGRAARWMSGQWDPVARKWSKFYDKICHELHMSTLQQRRLFLISCQVYKLIHKLDCIPFSKYLGFTRAVCTRSHNLCWVFSPALDTLFLVNCPLYHVVAAPSLFTFKSKLRNVLYAHVA